MLRYYAMPKKSSNKATPSVREALLLLKDASVAEIDHLIQSLHQVKAAREHLENIFAGTVTAARKVARTVATEAARVTGKGARKSGPKSAGNQLAPPRPGSLRAIVHAALKELGPTKTSDLIKHLEAKLGPEAGKSFRIRVNQVLVNRRDPFIKRVKRGVYQHT